MRIFAWIVAGALLGACERVDSSDVVTTGSAVTLGGTTATTTLTSGGTTLGSTSEEAQALVDAHNLVRETALPTPDPALPPMSWDTTLAQVAQDWADACDFNHSVSPYGENLYVSTSPNPGTRAVEAWAEEISDYDYESNTCTGVCGHYTQIVWRESTRVGCGFADCSTLTGASFGSGRLWVCNYDPPGNWVGEWPY